MPSYCLVHEFDKSLIKHSKTHRSTIHSEMHSVVIAKTIAKRDMGRHLNNPDRRWWNQYCLQFMVTFTRCSDTAPPPPPQSWGWFTKHLYDWMANASHLAKGVRVNSRRNAARCTLFGRTETQAHINTTCLHPSLQEFRMLHRRLIELTSSPFDAQDVSRQRTRRWYLGWAIVQPPLADILEYKGQKVDRLSKIFNNWHLQNYFHQQTPSNGATKTLLRQAEHFTC